jgi:glutathione S-transferase
MPTFYNAPNPAPNPRRVRIFLAEKGIEIPTRELSIIKGEHKASEFTAIYPQGQLPALELDDGRVIGESIAICRYFEVLHPERLLFGTDALSIAEIEMWVRRVEFTLMNPIGQVWMHTHPFTARVVVPQYTEFGERNRPKALAAMKRIDEALQGREFLAGDMYSMADIVLLTTIDFAAFIGVAMPDDLLALRKWHGRVSARPSASA